MTMSSSCLSMMEFLGENGVQGNGAGLQASVVVGEDVVDGFGGAENDEDGAEIHDRLLSVQGGAETN